MTHTTKHTPGPLDNVTGYKPGPWIRQVLNDESEAYIHDKHCNAIARVYSLSDAALIAAAPAMYEALSRLRNVASTASNHMRLSGNEEEALLFDNDQRVVEAALAQAEGAQHE